MRKIEGKRARSVRNGRGQTLCARSDERKLTHGGLRASIEFTPINTALCTPRRPFHGGNSESRRVFDPAEEKAARRLRIPEAETGRQRGKSDVEPAGPQCIA